MTESGWSSAAPEAAERASRTAGTRGALTSLWRSLVDPGTVLPLVLLAALATRIVWLDQPPGALVFDEVYYVNAARVILGLPVEPDAHYAASPVGLDPNLEHPPLGKALIAVSMQLFGDGAVGWRLPSVIAGMIALLAFYGIVRRSGATPRLAILALALLAFDNLTLVHGRIGTLDMLVLAPMLIGAWLAVRDRWTLAGIALGIALLVKITALYGVLALAVMIALGIVGRWRGSHRVTFAELRPAAAFAVSCAVVAVLGLWLLDLRLTTFTNPVDHVVHIVRYGTNLDAPDRVRGAGCAGSSAPWQWLFNDCEITYLRVTENRIPEDPGSSIATVDFRGALNPVLASAIPLAMLFLAWSAWKTGDPLARWAAIWAASNYLPYVVLALLSDRIMYLYYAVPLVPAVAVAVGILLERAGLPRIVRWGYVAAFGVAFVAYFPFRAIP